MHITTHTALPGHLLGNPAHSRLCQRPGYKNDTLAHTIRII